MSQQKRFERSEKSRELYAQVEFYEATYEGGDEYREMELLKKHPRESQGAYERRLEQSTYVNFAAPIEDLYTNYLHRDTPKRDTTAVEGVVFNKFWKDADLEGRSYEQVVRRISKEGGIKGCLGVVVDKPNITAASRAEELANDIRPYVVVYEPEDIWDWVIQRNKFGRPVLVKLVLKEDGDLIRVWYPDHWELWLQEDNKPPVMHGQGSCALGRIPFHLHRNRDNFERFGGLSDLVDIAELCKRIYGYDSAAQEIIDNTAFPFLEEPEEERRLGNTGSGEGEGEKVIGTGNVLSRPSGDTTGHRWVEPNHTSLAQLLEWRKAAVEDLRTISKMLSRAQTRTAMAGVAMEIEFQELNAMLSERAEGLETTELFILGTYADWERINKETLSVDYPRKFGVRDLAADIDSAIKAKALVPSKTYQRALEMDIVERTLPDAEQSVLDTIEKELEESAATTGFDKLVGATPAQPVATGTPAQPGGVAPAQPQPGVTA